MSGRMRGGVPRRKGLAGRVGFAGRIFPLGAFPRRVFPIGAFLAALLLVPPACAPAPDTDGEVASSHGQVARSTHGMVVSAKPLASAVGARVLEQGGNAVDAAVATAFALTVIEPSQSSLGGRTQILIRTPTGEVAGLDGGTEVVPGFDPARMPDAPEPTMGYGTIAVPGTVAALAEALDRYGTWELAEVLAPAIALAEEGFRLTPGQGERMAGAAEHLALYEGSRTHFLRPDGSPWEGGDLFVQPAVARTLRTLARDGPDVFYRGELADAIAAHIRANGGFVTREDLAAYRVREVPVARGSYRDLEVAGTYLPASGATVVQILQTLEALDELSDGEAVAGRVGSPEWADLLARALRAGFEDRLDVGGDPGAHVARITSPEWARERAAGILEGRAGNGTGAPLAEARGTTHLSEAPHATQLAEAPYAIQLAEAPYTTHLSAADRDGGLVALTQSIGPSFGSHVAHPELGFLFASTQGYLVSEPGTRPMSSMAPLFLLRDGEPAYVLGGAGARRIVSALVAVIGRAVDGGMPLTEAMAAPRFHALDGNEIRLEEREGAAWGEAAAEVLRGRGVTVSTSSTPGYFARLHAIERDPSDGSWVGVADSRRSGAAAAPAR